MVSTGRRAVTIHHGYEGVNLLGGPPGGGGGMVPIAVTFS